MITNDSLVFGIYNEIFHIPCGQLDFDLYEVDFVIVDFNIKTGGFREFDEFHGFQFLSLSIVLVSTIKCG